MIALGTNETLLEIARDQADYRFLKADSNSEQWWWWSPLISKLQWDQAEPTQHIKCEEEVPISQVGVV